MKPKSEFNLGLSRQAFRDAKIPYTSLNNDMHWKVIDVDFWPTSLKWQDLKKDKKGQGVFECIEYLRTKHPMYVHFPGENVITAIKCNSLSVQQIAKIFTKNQDKSLMEKCEILHKEIYG